MFKTKKELADVLCEAGRLEALVLKSTQDAMNATMSCLKIVSNIDPDKAEKFISEMYVQLAKQNIEVTEARKEKREKIVADLIAEIPDSIIFEVQNES